MYQKTDKNQLSIEEFILPFGGRLDEENRWVKLAGIMPWDEIEARYEKNFSEKQGRTAITARVAFGSIYIKEQENLTDEGCVRYIQENPYAQYFLGLGEFRKEPLFDPSMMVHFRRRFPAKDIAEINEYICIGKWPGERTTDDDSDDDSGNEPPKSSDTKGKANPNTSKKKQRKKLKNKGKLLMDATVAPADIRFPTDLSLLNQSRETLEEAIDELWPHTERKGHKTPYNRKKARKAYLKIAKSKKYKKSALRSAIGYQLECIRSAFPQVEALLAKAGEDKLSSWIKKRLPTIRKVYEQQKMMYDTRSSKCDDRIVSLHQPHVRPIVRGKSRSKYEFGQKLHLSVVDGYTFIETQSWDNFNEGSELQELANRYNDRFGYYPAAILADKIYQTRENRAFCKLHGIRLSGPPLGRPKKDQSEEARMKQTYQDACDRNAVEGRNGNLKRRFGLDLITSVLDENAKTEAALQILAMNLFQRLRSLFAQIFRHVIFLLCKKQILIF